MSAHCGVARRIRAQIPVIRARDVRRKPAGGKACSSHCGGGRDQLTRQHASIGAPQGARRDPSARSGCRRPAPRRIVRRPEASSANTPDAGTGCHCELDRCLRHIRSAARSVPSVECLTTPVPSAAAAAIRSDRTGAASDGSAGPASAGGNARATTTAPPAPARWCGDSCPARPRNPSARFGRHGVGQGVGASRARSERKAAPHRLGMGGRRPEVKRPHRRPRPWPARWTGWRDRASSGWPRWCCWTCGNRHRYRRSAGGRFQAPRQRSPADDQ